MPLFVLLLIIVFIYYGLPLLFLIGIINSIITYFIHKSLKREATILSMAFLFMAIIFYIISKIRTDSLKAIGDLLICGIFGGMFIYYIIILQAKKNDGIEEKFNERYSENVEDNNTSNETSVDSESKV